MFNSYKYMFGYGLYYFFNKNSYILENQKEPVHIVGNGWATYHFVKSLDKSKYITIVISPNNLVLNTTKLVDQINNPDDSKLYIKNQHIVHIQDKIVNIDYENKFIYSDSKYYKYKNLVLAIGSEVNDFGIEGVDLYTNKLKTINDVDNLRKKLTTSKSVYVIGAGPTGIELGVKLKQLGYDPVIIEGMTNILNGFSPKSQSVIYNYIKNNLGIKINLENPVKKITSDQIETKNSNYKYDTCVWVGGVKFNGYKQTKLFNKLESISKVSPRGIEVKENFSIYPNIYCIGDIVSNKGPPTAQNAKYQAKWLAQYFNNNFKFDNEYKTKELGKIIHLDDKLYLESKYYNGFLCKYLTSVVDQIFKM